MTTIFGEGLGLNALELQIVTEISNRGSQRLDNFLSLSAGDVPVESNSSDKASSHHVKILGDLAEDDCCRSSRYLSVNFHLAGRGVSVNNRRRQEPVGIKRFFLTFFVRRSHDPRQAGTTGGGARSGSWGGRRRCWRGLLRRRR